MLKNHVCEEYNTFTFNVSGGTWARTLSSNKHVFDEFSVAEKLVLPSPLLINLDLVKIYGICLLKLIFPLPPSTFPLLVLELPLVNIDNDCIIMLFLFWNSDII